MIFETLHDSAQRGELLLVDGGMCHWHLRRDGQITIREIISTRKGAGSQMLRRLELTPGAASLFAKCPIELPANRWYQKRGFALVSIEQTRTGRELLCWRKSTAFERRPNVGDLELIYCANGNRRFAEIAIDAGWLYGAQMPGSVTYRPYFCDQDWKAPDRAVYMSRLAEHRPHMATVLDLERESQLDEVLSWADEAAQHANVVIIIPKVNGIIARLPERVAGKPVRLGYSVPTRYGGTTVPLAEFADWPGGVHLLGGQPQKQITLYRTLPNVRSVDTNYHHLMALSFGEYWRVNGWIKISEADGISIKAPAYEAFRRSCHTIMRAWQDVVAERNALPLRIDDLPLFACAPPR